MKNREKRLLLAALTFTLLTVALIYIIIIKDLTTIDDKVHSLIATWWKEELSPIIRGFTFLADTKTSFILTVIALGYLVYKKLYKYGFLLITSMGGGVIITYIMKTTIARDRPGEIAHMNIWGLFTDRVSYSFPSGHALKALLLFGVVIYTIYWEMEKGNLRKWLISGLVFIITVVGIGQILLHRHFASDIVGGYLVALAWLFFCIAINEPLMNFIRNILPEGARNKLEGSIG
ncbi:phosphatase PAP2 family protein [Alkalicella caledoniensis]|uniref:Phosphatase PAP2 family protein n=1 Tax=Alkalicella caledoniensis TaxID=2731377 RepID=A0A7G9W9Y4_ALKCA|nr:phosphatase PAP2 family protein [Alkalicella caledoniensis]QNO15496.1 phosphatase PAP2 family protein [Alkalicella caledoniensis]